MIWCETSEAKFEGARRFAERRFPEASELFDKITADEQFVEFLTLPGYERLS